MGVCNPWVSAILAILERGPSTVWVSAILFCLGVCNPWVSAILRSSLQSSWVSAILSVRQGCDAWTIVERFQSTPCEGPTIRRPHVRLTIRQSMIALGVTAVGMLGILRARW